MRFNKSPVRVIAATGCSLILACVLSVEKNKTSSTSISAGNPVGLRIDFESDYKQIKLSGSLEIYGSHQIPVRGFSPSPLARINFSETTNASLDTTILTGISDSIWKKNTVASDSIFRFNLVVMSDSMVAVLKEFGFQRNPARILPRGLTMDSGFSNGGCIAKAKFSKLVFYEGNVAGYNLSKMMDYHMFIYGTGFTAKGTGILRDDTGSLHFEFPRIPEGANEMFLIPLPGKDNLIGGVTVTDIWNLKEPFVTENTLLYRGDIYKSIELPDSLKIK